MRINPMQIEKCDVCGKLTAALSVCRLCKRRVCEEHFKHKEGVCSLCHSRLSETTQATEETLMSSILFKLFLFGFLLMSVGVVVLVVAALLRGDTTVSAGLIIIVGFIPIVLGAGPYAFFAILLAAVLTIIAFVVFFWMRKEASSG